MTCLKKIQSKSLFWSRFVLSWMEKNLEHWLQARSFICESARTSRVDTASVCRQSSRRFWGKIMPILPQKVPCLLFSKGPKIWSLVSCWGVFSPGEGYQHSAADFSGYELMETDKQTIRSKAVYDLDHNYQRFKNSYEYAGMAIRMLKSLKNYLPATARKNSTDGGRKPWRNLQARGLHAHLNGWMNQRFTFN